ncbi:MAG: hypothetical protein MJE12_25170 [Alphaproteobacteria bacterium]|nr:hypothetical protein [Alphaproteobacteria bacterium]
MKQNRCVRMACLATAAAAGMALLASTATAQMLNEPRQFKQRDAAGIAFSLRQLRNSQSVTAAPGGDSTILVCGGPGGGATSTANSSCIILNNSDSTLGIGQGSEGDQNSDSTIDTTTNTTTADEVSNILNQQNNSTNK